jgi:hypothetical protein
MVSVYGYGTLAILETVAKRDYSAIHATIFSDANVERSISDAELLINGYTGTIFTGTIPPDIAECTYLIAKILLDNVLKEYGLGGKELEKIPPVTEIFKNADIIAILEKYRSLYNTNKNVFISKESHVNATRTYTRPWGY